MQRGARRLRAIAAGVSGRSMSAASEEGYVPSKVWTWNQGADDNKFASINRPISGARHEKELPVGEHPIQLYSLGTPNGVKVTVLLEELLELKKGPEYDAWVISIMQGDQFGSGFVEINPNSKIPALVDRSDGRNQRVFESGAILLYLAEKYGAFIPTDPVERTECMNWLFWQMGTAPVLGGGFGHFFNYAHTKQEYPINRFSMEVKRQLDVLDKLLAGRKYIAGESYSIADMAIFPWYGALVEGKLYTGSAEFLQVHTYENVVRWAREIAARPAVQRGRRVNRTCDEKGLRERHSSEDFQT